MDSDEGYTATGSTLVAFQTDVDEGEYIHIGADVAGDTYGARGSCDGGGPGVIGQADIAGDPRFLTSFGSDFSGAKGVGVLGMGSRNGVYGLAQSSTPEDITGVLAEGYKGAFGVTGVSFDGPVRNELGHGAGVIGASNADSQRDPSKPNKRLGAGVVGLSLNSISTSLEPALHHLPDPKKVPDGTGTGVWGASGSGTGIHGESNSGRGAVFESTKIAQLRLVPLLDPHPNLPETGELGDLYVVSVPDPNHILRTFMFLCVKPSGITVAEWAPFELGSSLTGGSNIFGP
jgi:hypothetical protein